MKAVTYLASFALAGTTMVSTALAATPKGWTTDLEQAFKDAKAKNKAVLVEFTGSDWCPPCKMMHKNVFSKEDFVTKAAEDFILVELDFPRGDEAVTEKNKPYAEKYEIEGFPTVILFDKSGKEMNRFFASEFPSVDKFLAHLDQVTERAQLD
ncbi:thiol:disulfide interchange protein [Haloferula luteola]|uniref:Thiol:disulfide interchange protein n=1 Tax=Haloferula luteola TaxID=595692 RepID=A0A840UW83_9BACT|nr:thioredoxin family protein [Haloferula luteola]MBB5350427.1 thiol:disulfide interchange protein [Haloferula luteola]